MADMTRIQSKRVNSEPKSSDSFHQDLQEFPPDLAELTQGFQNLMSKFLLSRDRQNKIKLIS